MTKLGLSSGWWSSMLIVSPLRVMGPLASTVGDDWVTAGFRPVEVPGERSLREPGPPIWIRCVWAWMP